MFSIVSITYDIFIYIFETKLKIRNKTLEYIYIILMLRITKKQRLDINGGTWFIKPAILE